MSRAGNDEKENDTPKSVLGNKRELVDSVQPTAPPTEEGSACPAGAEDAKYQRIYSPEEYGFSNLVPLHGDKGPLAIVTMEQFESILSSQSNTGSMGGVESPKSFLEFGKDFNLPLNKDTLATYAIYCNVAQDEHTTFLKARGSEYTSLVIDDCVTATDVITWFEDNRNIDARELRKEFKMHQYGSFMSLLNKHNHIEMMPDAKSTDLYRPMVVIEDLAVKISLFELILHIRDPDVSKTYMLQDRYTVASSHVPALFRDADSGSMHLYWSTPWPLGLVELPGNAEERYPFNAKHILVFGNSIFFSLFTGDIMCFNKQGRVTRYCSNQKKEITIKAADLVHAGLNGVTIEEIQKWCNQNMWETDHCPIFHMQHSAHTTRLATKAQNCRNQFSGRSLFGCTRYLTKEEIEKILGRMSNPKDDPSSWYKGWLAHHSHDMGKLQKMARAGKTLKVPLKRVDNIWFHIDTSMMCRQVNGRFEFAMPEGCGMETRVAYPRITANIKDTKPISLQVRVHLILYDSFQRYKTYGEYTERPLIQKIGDECHVMVVDHCKTDVDLQSTTVQTSDMNQIRKMTARAEYLELVTCRENVVRSIGYKAFIQIEGPDGTVCKYQSVSKATMFAFLQENFGDSRVTDQSLKYWWQHRFAKGAVKDVILEKKLTVTLNGFRIIERGIVSEQANEARKSKTDLNGLDRLWVFVFFGDPKPVVRYVSGIPACRALLQKYAPSENETPTLFTQPLRLKNNYLSEHKCLFRPVNKTPESEIKWEEELGHIPLSVIMKNDEESMNQIVEHYAKHISKPW